MGNSVDEQFIPESVMCSTRIERFSSIDSGISTTQMNDESEKNASNEQKELPPGYRSLCFEAVKTYLYVYEEKQLYTSKSMKNAHGRVYRCRNRRCSSKVILTPNNLCIKSQTGMNHCHDNDEAAFEKLRAQIAGSSLTNNTSSSQFGSTMNSNNPTTSAAIVSVASKSSSSAKLFECDYCRKRLASKYNLKNHISKHTGNRPYECKETKCDKRFASSQGLQCHEKIHSKEREICDICGNDYKKLKEHKRNKHPEFMLLNCDKCEKQFQSKRKLKQHMKYCNSRNEQNENNIESNNENNTEIYECEICEDLFTSKELVSVILHEKEVHNWTRII